MEETPPFEIAIARFKEFLRSQGWPCEISWRRDGEIFHCLDHRILVRRRASGPAADEARAHYEAGRLQGVGVEITAYCQIAGAACATVYWSDDSDEAERHLMPPTKKTGGPKPSRSISCARLRFRL
jgi:hypothetical protein